jgi:Fasciclin domain
VRCEFLTAVWGPWHTHVFAELALPSLLAQRNLPKFVSEVESTYLIHTRAHDAEIIGASCGFRSLGKIMDVKLVTHPEKTFGDPVATHTKIWLNGVKRAQRRNAFIAALPADMIWADGAYESVMMELKRGKKAIYAMFVRVTSETFIEAYEKSVRHDATAGSASITPRALVTLMQRHIHPLHAAYLRDGDHFPFHSEYILWPVGAEGFVMRSLATTILMFHAVEYSVNSQFSLARNDRPEEVAFMTDTDTICGVSLTPILKDMDWYLHPRRADLDEIGSWWIDFDGPAHLDLARQYFRFHEGDVTESLWRNVERQSDFFVAQALIAREITRIGRVLKEHNYVSASTCLAVALYAGRLRRHWCWRGPVTVFAPDENSFSALSANQLKTLLSKEGDEALRNAVLSHVVSGQVDLRSERDVQTVNGNRLKVSKDSRIRINGCPVLETISLPHGNMIHVIDGLLSGLA